MKCDRYEKWMSDDLDGGLSRGRKDRLERHILTCRRCRTALAEMAGLQKAAGNLLEPGRGPEFWEDFERRLDSRISNDDLSGRQDRAHIPLEGRWVLSGAVALLTMAVGLYVLLSPTRGIPQSTGLSAEDSLSTIFNEIGDDSDLEASFHEVIISALEESAGLGATDLAPQFRDNPLFWESLSDEELISIERGLQMENRITEVPHESD